MGRRIGIHAVEIIEIRESRARNGEAHDRRVDCARQSCRRAAVVILDERGENLDSRSFATKLGRWRDASRMRFS
jgi:23S rRNA (pseudouridine1915-N3)-methyltransferase